MQLFTCCKNALGNAHSTFQEKKYAGHSALKLFLFAGLILGSVSVNAQTGTWTALTHTSPHYNEGEMLLLTDGTVIAKTSSGGSDGYGNTWDKLTPDIHGSYQNGTWTTIATMSGTRLYFSSQVLPDGRVYIAGGEYGTGGAYSEVYNPLTNTWTSPLAPSGTNVISDANSELLANGNVLQALVDAFGTTHNFIWNASTNTYSAAGNCLRTDNEAVWVKLPDYSIIFADNYNETTERYIPATNTWINDATMPVNLYDPYGYEAGAAFLLPDGRVFFIGSTPVTAYYTPSGTTAPGSWTTGPAIPSSQGAPDAASAMMVNGKIILAVSPTPTAANNFPSPTTFYEFDYTSNTFTAISAPGGGTSLNQSSFITNFLDLPDGNVLYANDGTDQYYVYTPGTAALAAGQPTISNITMVNCDTFMATGTLFNGITEGAAYGDDWQMSTNYPIVRLTSGTNVYYARSYGWNRIGAVSTGVLPDTTMFVLPAGIPNGTYATQVIANGNASASHNITVGPQTITPATPTVCTSGTVSLTAVTSGGAWTSSNGNTSVNASTGLVTGQAQGTSVITYNAGTTCASTTTVTVNAAPGAVSISGPAQLCTTGSASYSVATIPNTTGYNWTVSGVGWSGTSTTNNIAVTAGTGTGTVTCSGQNTCGAGPVSTQTVVIGGAVPVTVNEIDTPTLICNTYAATFETPAIPNATSYNWTISGTGWSGTSTTNVITVNVGSGTGSLTVSAANACGTGGSYTLQVPPHFAPTSAPVFNPASTPCVGNMTTYTVGTVTNATEYIWSVTGSGWTANASTTTTDEITAGTGAGIITCQASNSCGLGPATTLNVTPAAVPAMATSINTSLIMCAGDTATLSTPAIGNATSYQWIVSGTGWSGSSNTNTVLVTTGSGTGTISVNGINDCGSGPVYSINNVHAIPVPTAIYAASSHNVNIGATVSLIYAGNADTSATYTWSFDGGTANPGTGQGPQHVSWSTSGMKHVTLEVSSGGCSSTYTDSILVSIPADVQITTLDNNTTISPNPNDGTFDILFSQSVSEPVIVTLLDMRGRVVYKNQFNGRSISKVTIATNDLANAVYTANINVNGIVVNKKVVINR